MSTPAAAARPHEADLPGALAAALPRQGFWSAPIVAAVSGGADSVGLLLALRAAAVRESSSSRIVVCHVRHDLRERAADDAVFVADLAARMALPCVVKELVVRGVRDRGEGVEALARRGRLKIFAEVACERGARHVVVAHTADDQAETILHRILRGTGPAGLRGMAASRELCHGVALMRPLLTVSRHAVREYLAALGEPWCEDESNADTRYARNFLRQEILPRCHAGPYPVATTGLVRLGSQAAALAGAIRSAAEHLLQSLSRRQPDGSIVIRGAALGMLDRHLVAEIFVALWERQAWPRRDMTARHYAQLAEMAAAADKAGIPLAVDLPGGIRVRRCPDGLVRIDGPEAS